MPWVTFLVQKIWNKLYESVHECRKLYDDTWNINTHPKEGEWLEILRKEGPKCLNI